MRFGVFMPKMRPNGRGFESPVGANNYFSQKIHKKRKIDAECSKINCNCHRNIENDYLHWFYVSNCGFYAIVLWVYIYQLDTLSTISTSAVKLSKLENPNPQNFNYKSKSICILSSQEPCQKFPLTHPIRNSHGLLLGKTHQFPSITLHLKTTLRSQFTIQNFVKKRFQQMDMGDSRVHYDG
jgi:hypothetical protein